MSGQLEDRESVQALEATQNPRGTAKETTSTKNFNPKQTHASKGAIKFVQITEDETT